MTVDHTEHGCTNEFGIIVQVWIDDIFDHEKLLGILELFSIGFVQAMLIFYSHVLIAIMRSETFYISPCQSSAYSSLILQAFMSFLTVSLHLNLHLPPGHLHFCSCYMFYVSDVLSKCLNHSNVPPVMTNTIGRHTSSKISSFLQCSSIAYVYAHCPSAHHTVISVSYAFQFAGGLNK